MLSTEQIKKIEHSFKHGDNLVFTVNTRTFVSDTILKHRKEATIEMMHCSEIDESCFDSNGEYNGDVLPGLWRVILQDPYADSSITVASLYYRDEIALIRKEDKYVHTKCSK